MAAHPGWPAELTAGAVTLRPPRRGDARTWSEVRLSNEAWLKPWEPTGAVSWRDRHARTAWTPLLSALRAAARAGTMLPFVIEYGDRLVGQISAANIQRGVLRSTAIGYWLDQAVAGRGIAPTAVALLVDHCLGPAQLHRVQIDVRPENAASLRVVEKLGLRYEGRLERYLDIDGGWRDHLSFAVTVEELAGASMLARLRSLPVPPERPLR